GTLSQGCSMSLIGPIGPISLIGGQSPFYRASTIFRSAYFFGKFANLPEGHRVFVGDDRIGSSCRQFPDSVRLPLWRARASTIDGRGTHDFALHACAAPVGCGQAVRWLARGLDRTQVRPRRRRGGSPHARQRLPRRQLQPLRRRPHRQALLRARPPGPEEGAPGGQALRLAALDGSPRRLDRPPAQLEGPEAALHARRPRRLAALLPR